MLTVRMRNIGSLFNSFCKNRESTLYFSEGAKGVINFNNESNAIQKCVRACAFRMNPNTPAPCTPGAVCFIKMTGTHRFLYEWNFCVNFQLLRTFYLHKTFSESMGSSYACWFSINVIKSLENHFSKLVFDSVPSTTNQSKFHKFFGMNKINNKNMNFRKPHSLAISG